MGAIADAMATPTLDGYAPGLRLGDRSRGDTLTGNSRITDGAAQGVEHRRVRRKTTC